MENKNVRIEVTTQTVKEAFDKIGMIPKAKKWYSKEENCCCGLSALALCQVSKEYYEDKLENSIMDMDIFMQETLNLTYNEVWAFIYGFDGKVLKSYCDEESFNEMKEMYKIGRETSNLLLGTNYTLI